MSSNRDDSQEGSRTIDLVAAARRGSGSAIEQLTERCLPRVRQIVSLRLGWRLQQFAELDDVVQEVMIRVITGIGRFESRSDGAFQNWLARCVENEIRDQAKRLGRQKRGVGKVRRFGDCASSILHSSIFAVAEPTPSEYALADETAAKLEECLLAMPEYQREVVILRAVCGMSPSEVAEELDIANEHLVSVAYSRVLQKLKREIGLA